MSEVELTLIERDTLARELLTELARQFPTKGTVALSWRPYRTTAGRAHCNTFEITLSHLVLLTAEQVRSTLVHEYAHLLTYERYGRAGLTHGRAWQSVMAELGEPPEVRHRYQCTRNESRQIVFYRCQRCGAQFERKRRLPRRRKYMHQNCGGTIQFTGITERS